MNEIILAYGLGIVSIGTGVLVRMVLKAEKKVNQQEKLLAEIQREYQRSVEGVYQYIKTSEHSTNSKFEIIDRKIDSRIDKLDFRITDQLNYIKSKTSQAY
jgi:predicted component of type VI protein secretion system